MNGVSNDLQIEHHTDTTFSDSVSGGALSTLSAGTMGQGAPVCDEDPTFPNPLTSNGGYFASDIGLDGAGDLAIVGANRDDGPLDINVSGTARMFYAINGAWEEHQTIRPDDPDPGELFGESVDIDGDTAIIAAPGTATAYIFRRDIYQPLGVQWYEDDTLTGSTSESFAGNGAQHESVAISGDFAAVSAMSADVHHPVTGENIAAAGVVYVYSYDRAIDAWFLEDTLHAPDPQEDGEFGWSIEMSGSRIIVGAKSHDVGEAMDAGAAFIFSRDVFSATPDWPLEATLAADSPQDNQAFGRSVSIDGNFAAVGAPGNVANYSAGMTVVFRNSIGGWAEQATVDPSNGASGDQFGFGVSISGSLLVVGARGYDVGTVSSVGTAYLYSRSGSSWGESRQFITTDPGPNDNERGGETLAIAGDEVFIGVPGDDAPNAPNESQHGSVLIYSDVPPDCGP